MPPRNKMEQKQEETTRNISDMKKTWAEFIFMSKKDKEKDESRQRRFETAMTRYENALSKFNSNISKFTDKLDVQIKLSDQVDKILRVNQKNIESYFTKMMKSESDVLKNFSKEQKESNIGKKIQKSIDFLNENILELKTALNQGNMGDANAIISNIFKTMNVSPDKEVITTLNDMIRKNKELDRISLNISELSRKIEASGKGKDNIIMKHDEELQKNDHSFWKNSYINGQNKFTNEMKDVFQEEIEAFSIIKDGFKSFFRFATNFGKFIINFGQFSKSSIGFYKSFKNRENKSQGIISYANEMASTGMLPGELSDALMGLNALSHIWKTIGGVAGFIKNAAVLVGAAKVISGLNDDDPSNKLDARKNIGGGVGMIGGALAGSKLGATIGTMVAPGIGTLIGSILGGVGGTIVGEIGGSKIAEYWDDIVNAIGKPFIAVGKFINDYIPNDGMALIDKIKEYFNIDEIGERIVNWFKSIITPIKNWFGENIRFPDLSTIEKDKNYKSTEFENSILARFFGKTKNWLTNNIAIPGNPFGDPVELSNPEVGFAGGGITKDDGIAMLHRNEVVFGLDKFISIMYNIQEKSQIFLLNEFIDTFLDKFEKEFFMTGKLRDVIADGIVLQNKSESIFSSFFGSKNIPLTEKTSPSIGDKVTSFFGLKPETKLESNKPQSFYKSGITLPITDHGLGTLSAKYESGGRGVGTISSGIGDLGGKSYGIHQMASAGGENSTLGKFLVASGYADQFSGLQIGSPEFDAKYRNIAKNDPNFGDAQRSYIKSTHYNPAAAFASKLGFNMNNRAVQESIFSGSVQHGKINQVLSMATSGKGDFSKLSPEEQINAFYDARTKYTNSLQSVQFSAGEGRYIRERIDALKIAEQLKEQNNLNTISKEIPKLENDIQKINSENEQVSNNGINTLNTHMASANGTLGGLQKGINGMGNNLSYLPGLVAQTGGPNIPEVNDEFDSLGILMLNKVWA